MSQLKQDEWPAENEPTTTEAQIPTPGDAERAHRGESGEPHARRSRGEPQENGAHPAADELSNVTPDQQVD